MPALKERPISLKPPPAEEAPTAAFAPCSATGGGGAGMFVQLSHD